MMKFSEPLPKYLLTRQVNSDFLGRFFFCTGQQQLWRCSWNFKIIFSRPLFTIIFKPKMVISRLKILVTYSSCSRWCVFYLFLLASPRFSDLPMVLDRLKERSIELEMRARQVKAHFMCVMPKGLLCDWHIYGHCHHQRLPWWKKKEVECLAYWVDHIPFSMTFEHTQKEKISWIEFQFRYVKSFHLNEFH